jgi:hypothetical protein
MPIAGPCPCPWWLQTAPGDTSDGLFSCPLTVAIGHANALLGLRYRRPVLACVGARVNEEVA